MSATSLVVIATGDPAEVALAARLGLVLRPPSPGAFGLRFRDGALELCDLAAGAPGPVSVDAIDGPLGHRLREGPGRDEPLARAVGVRRHGIRPIFDATPGLARDAFLLARLGCRVTAAERHPVMHALLADGIERASQDDVLLPLAERIELMAGDAARAIPTLAEAPMVVLIDPMFPDRKSSAMVRKEMRLVRRVVGDDDDAPALLDVALCHATDRVVVRRPRGAHPLPHDRSPDLTVGGRRTRFDVYLTRS